MKIKQALINNKYLRRPKTAVGQKGIALLQALFLVLLITFIVNQVNFEVAVEYTVNAQAIHRIRAYQAAKASMNLSLLRLKIYNTYVQNYGEQLGDQAHLLSMIYKLPISWPLALPEEVSAVDKDGFNKLNKSSLMDAQFSSSIDADDKLNINDLNSPIENQRQRIKTKIIDLLQGRLEGRDEWAQKNREINPEEIANNLKDWIDGDTEGSNGGSEGSNYDKVKALDRDNKDSFPPNRYFRTIDEIRMVPGVTDDVFEVLSQTFSVFGPMGINPNYADAGTLKSLHKTFTDEIVNKVMQRRDNPKDGGHFQDKEDFISFVSSLGANLNQEEKEQMLLRFKEPCNFKIQATGASGKSNVTITAITYDLHCAQKEVSKAYADEQKNKNGSSSNTSSGATSGDSTSTKEEKARKQPLPKGPPRIVYWNER